MTQYTVNIQPEADLDIDEAYEYSQIGLGMDFLADITDTIALLESSPFLFQVIYAKRRRAISKRFKFNIIYLIENQELYILAILHGNVKPGKWQKR